MAEETSRNRTQLRRLMANRTIIAILIVDDARYRLRLNWSNAESLFDQAEDNGHFLKAEPDADDPYLWLRITRRGPLTMIHLITDIRPGESAG